MSLKPSLIIIGLFALLDVVVGFHTAVNIAGIVCALLLFLAVRLFKWVTRR